MNRLHIGGLSLLLAHSFATPALAGITVSVDPHPVRQCDETQVIMTLSNDTSEPMDMEVVGVLKRGSKDVGRLHMGRFLLAANETQVYEFNVTMPAIPPGGYDLTLQTLVNYAVGEEASTQFNVGGESTACPIAAPADLLANLRFSLTGSATGSSPRGQNELESNKASTTWQEFKTLYR